MSDSGHTRTSSGLRETLRFLVQHRMVQASRGEAQVKVRRAGGGHVL